MGLPGSDLGAYLRGLVGPSDRFLPWVSEPIDMVDLRGPPVETAISPGVRF